MNRISIAALTVAATSLALGGCSGSPAEPAALTQGSWTLNNAASDLSYVTIKAEEIAEANSFEKLSGSVSPNGAAQVEVDLASVSTGVDIRDERMRDIAFVVADNPTASVTAQIDPAAFETLGVGDNLEQSLDGTLTLKNIEAPFTAQVQVTRTGPDSVLVVSAAPVIISASEFELTDELAELQGLANLPSIVPVVPVSFSLRFER